MVTLERVPAAVEALVEALEGDLLQQEWLLAALQESAGSGAPACLRPGVAAWALSIADIGGGRVSERGTSSSPGLGAVCVAEPGAVTSS